MLQQQKEIMFKHDCRLTPRLTMFKLLYGGKFYWWENHSIQRKQPTRRQLLITFF
jgi:hypothetical protein